MQLEYNGEEEDEKGSKGLNVESKAQQNIINNSN
jgi:hypothetical protein